MRRARKAQKGSGISAFVAIGPLCCLVAAGAFGYATSALFGGDSSKAREAEEIARNIGVERQRLKELMRELEADQNRLETLDGKIANMSKRRDSGNRYGELKRLQELEAEDLERQIEELEELKAEYSGLGDDVRLAERHRDRGAMLEQAVPFYRAKIEAHRKLIDELTEKTKEIRARGNEPVYTVGAWGGRGRNRPALFVESDGRGVVVQPQADRLPPEPNADQKARFLRAVREKGYVVFFVRPSGISSFEEYRTIVAEEIRKSRGKIDIGYEPIDESWRLAYP